MTDQNFDSELNFLKCISGEIRFEILHLLRKRPLSVGRIAGEVDVDQTLASHHLKKMYDCGIVEKERNGKKIIYSISSDSITDLIDDLENVCGEVC